MGYHCWLRNLNIRGACMVAATLVAAFGTVQAAQVEATKPDVTTPLYRASVLVDAVSGQVLSSSHEDLRLPPASLTKMMLMLLVAERVRDGRLHWDDPIHVSDWASRIGGSQVYLRAGEVFSLGDLMQAIAIHSANDAAVAVAEAVAGSSTNFVELMNQRARELGMRGTVYRSVHGLPPAKGQQQDLTTANDIAILARALVAHPDVMRWAGTRKAEFRNGTMTLTNTNQLVQRTNWVDGLKTGYFGAAGFNVAATASRDGLRLIAVVLGAREKRACFDTAEALLKHGFGQYQALVALREGETVASDVAVKGGRPRFVRVVAGGDVSVLARRGEKRRFSLELELADPVTAPLEARAPVGEVVVRDGDTVVGRVPALAGDPVERSFSWDRFF
jgi:D-alanyl-D-alanine carboxypeptidase (penicillin-binding protein 5/6)